MYISNNLPAIHFTPWGQLSGAQRSLLGLVEEQTKRQPTGLLILNENSVGTRAKALGAKVMVMHAHDGKKFEPIVYTSQIESLKNLALEVGANIIHCHSAYGMRYILKIAREANLKIVCHQRDNYLDDDFHRDLKHADTIISISWSVYKTLPEMLQKRSTVIYNGMRIPHTCLSGSGTGIRIGMAGRSIQEKGAHLFLDAVLLLMADYNFEVWIWGLWSSRTEDISQEIIDRVNGISEQFRKRITLEPFREDIENFYKNVDIVVIPSLHPEPFGRMALESMACGCATIVAGHGGLSEIVDDKVTGLLFEPGNEKSLSSQIGLLLSDEQLRSDIRRKGPEKSLEKFSPEKHYDEIQSIYEMTINNSGK